MSQESAPDRARGRESISLSPRQRQILTLLRDGKPNKEIAHELGIGLGTVKQHLVTLFKKLGVTSRAMAVSKSYTLDDLSINGPVALEHGPSPETEPDLVLERRPVAVLSLQAMPEASTEAETADRELYRVFADIAFDFGAVFLSHHGGRCDMVFGIRQVRRHDVLRAVRACLAVSEELRARRGVERPVKAGLAFGYIYVSTDDHGEWTGEAIGGKVVTAARGLLAETRPGTVRLHAGARQIISSLGLTNAEGVPEAVPLDRKFRWRRVQPKPPQSLLGRVVELQALRSRLVRLSKTGAGLVIIEGESGMGKTALAQSFLALAEQQGAVSETWLCSIPDSQPGDASRGRVERAESDEAMTVQAFADSLAQHPPAAPHVIVVEDTHLLPDDDFAQLTAVTDRFMDAPVLLVLTYRGHADPAAPPIDILHLEHLPSEGIDEWLEKSPLADGDEKRWVEQMARGVPGFLVRLAEYAGAPAFRSRGSAARLPPPDIFALVAARIEAHGLNRRLLHIVSRADGPLSLIELRNSWPDDRPDLDKALDQAVSAGVLRRTGVARSRSDTVEIAHPLVGWISAAAFPPRNRTFEYA